MNAAMNSGTADVFNSEEAAVKVLLRTSQRTMNAHWKIDFKALCIT